MENKSENYDSGFDLIYQLEGLYIGEIYSVIYRQRKIGYEDVVDNILGYLINHNSQEKEIKCYEAMLYNLCYNHSKGYDGVFVSFRKADYPKKHPFNGAVHYSWIYGEGVREFTEKMEKLGYVKHKKGGWLGGNMYRRGYVLLTEKFKREIEEFGEAKIKPHKDLIKLKERKTKKSLYFTQTEEVLELKTFIETYNEKMSQIDVRLNGRRLDSDIFRLYLDNLMSYGRFHNPVFQSIPSDERKDITFNDYATVELDLQSSHATILYAMEGIDITQKDLYDPFYLVDMSPLEFWNYNDCILTRKDVKEFFKALINCRDRKQALQMLANNSILNVKYGRKHEFYEQMITVMLEQHQHIAEYFLKDISMQVMYEESEYLLEVLEQCMEHNLPVLPIHDSLICLEQNSQQVSNMMRSVFYSRWGVDCKINIK